MKLTAKDIAINGIIAAIYVVLTLLTYPFSFLGLQIRLAEMMVLLCFFRKNYILGLTTGCAIANLFSSIGIIDVAFGTLATFLSCLCICFCKHLLGACIFPILFNSGIIGLELYFFANEGGANSFWLFAVEVLIGELIAITLGYVLFQILKRNTRFLKLIRAKQNLDFKV